MLKRELNMQIDNRTMKAVREALDFARDGWGVPEEAAVAIDATEWPPAVLFHWRDIDETRTES